MLSGSTLRMKISVGWKNLLDKCDNIDWINTITRRKLMYGYTESPDLGLALAQMTCVKSTVTCPRPANLVESKTWRFWSKNFFWAPSWRSGGMHPQEILKIIVMRLAANAFPTF